MSQPSTGVGRTLSTIDEPSGSVDLPCQHDDPDLWFAEHPVHINRAKELCAECPVREACLAGALDRGEAAGVWGGELLVNGVIVANKRGRGRPRKNAA